MFVDKDLLMTQLLKQLNSFYIIDDEDIYDIKLSVDKALRKLEYSFSYVSNKYYSNDGNVKFDLYHSCQYGQFLYYLSNTIYHNPDRKSGNICDKLYQLNKVMLSCDMFYAIDLPSIFFFDPPLGTVLGRAQFNDLFSFSQGCTVGNNNGIYPKFGKRVHMLSNSKVIGDCNIGNNVIISANTYIKDTDIPDNSIVFGQDQNLIIKEVPLEKIMAFSKNIFLN